MTDQLPRWPIEQRAMPPHLAAEAAAHPGGWVYEIDGSMVGNRTATFPPKRSSAVSRSVQTVGPPANTPGIPDTARSAPIRRP